MRPRSVCCVNDTSNGDVCLTQSRCILYVYRAARYSVHRLRNYMYNCSCVFGYTSCAIYRVSQEEWTKIRERVPYVELYRYKSKHLYPKLNGYRDNGYRKVWASGVSTYYTPSVTPYWTLRMPGNETPLANIVMR